MVDYNITIQEWDKSTPIDSYVSKVLPVKGSHILIKKSETHKYFFKVTDVYHEPVQRIHWGTNNGDGEVAVVLLGEVKLIPIETPTFQTIQSSLFNPNV